MKRPSYIRKDGKHVGSLPKHQTKGATKKSARERMIEEAETRKSPYFIPTETTQMFDKTVIDPITKSKNITKANIRKEAKIKLDAQRKKKELEEESKGESWWNKQVGVSQPTEREDIEYMANRYAQNENAPFWQSDVGETIKELPLALAWEASPLIRSAASPYVKKGFQAAGKGLKTLKQEAIYNAIDPLGYGVASKILKAPETFVKNVFNPKGRPGRIGTGLQGINKRDAEGISFYALVDNPQFKDWERLGMNRLDAWRKGLGLKQKYGTFEEVGDKVRIKDFEPSPLKLSTLYNDILANKFKQNNATFSGEGPLQELAWRNKALEIPEEVTRTPYGNVDPYHFVKKLYPDIIPWQQTRAVEAAKNPLFKHSVYDADSATGIMGGYRWDVKKTDDGLLHFQANDTWDLHPWKERGNILAKQDKLDQMISNEHAKKGFLKNIEFLDLLGGKPYDIQNNFLVNPKTFKIIKKWKHGGTISYKKKDGSVVSMMKRGGQLPAYQTEGQTPSTLDIIKRRKQQEAMAEEAARRKSAVVLPDITRVNTPDEQVVKTKAKPKATVKGTNIPIKQQAQLKPSYKTEQQRIEDEARGNYIENPTVMDYLGQAGYMPLLAMSDPFSMGDKLKQLRTIQSNPNLTHNEKFNLGMDIANEAVPEALLNVAVGEGLGGLSERLIQKAIPAPQMMSNLFSKLPKNYAAGVGPDWIPRNPASGAPVGNIDDIKKSFLLNKYGLKTDIEIPNYQTKLDVDLINYNNEYGTNLNVRNLGQTEADKLSGYTDIPQFNEQVKQLMATAQFGKRPLLSKKDFFTNNELNTLIKQYKDYYAAKEAFENMNPEEPGMMIFRALSGDKSSEEAFKNLFPNAKLPNFRSKFIQPNTLNELRAALKYEPQFNWGDPLNPKTLKSRLQSQLTKENKLTDVAKSYQDMLNRDWHITDPKGYLQEMKGVNSVKGLTDDEISNRAKEVHNELVKYYKKRYLQDTKKPFKAIEALQSIQPNKKGGELRRYQTDGEIDTYVNQNKEFLRNMAQSPLFAERYSKMTGITDAKKAEKYKNKLLKNIENVDVELNPQSRKLIKKHAEGFYTPFRHKITVGTPDENTILHELSHSSTKGGRGYPSKQYINLQNKWNYDPSQGTKMWEDKYKQLQGTELYDKLMDAVLGITREYAGSSPEAFSDLRDYYTDPSEIKARVDVARKYLQQKGLYDPVKQKFTEKDYENLKNEFLKEKSTNWNMNILDLLNNYSKEDLIDMFNSFVSNNPNDIRAYAKKGGQLRKYQNGNQVDTPEEWEKQIRAVEQRIGDPKKWTQENYEELQNKLNEYKNWRENTPKGRAVIDYHNEPNEYVIPLPSHLKIVPKKKGGPIVTTEGFKMGPPPQGSYYRIPSDTLYNPTDYTIEAIADTGERKVLKPRTGNTKFDGASYVDEYQMKGLPKAQKGLPPIYVTRYDDPRHLAYADSLNAYNQGIRNLSQYTKESNEAIAKYNKGLSWYQPNIKANPYMKSYAEYNKEHPNNYFGYGWDNLKPVSVFQRYIQYNPVLNLGLKDSKGYAKSPYAFTAPLYKKPVQEVIYQEPKTKPYEVSVKKTNKLKLKPKIKVPVNKTTEDTIAKKEGTSKEKPLVKNIPITNKNDVAKYEKKIEDTGFKTNTQPIETLSKQADTGIKKAIWKNASIDDYAKLVNTQGYKQVKSTTNPQVKELYDPTGVKVGYWNDDGREINYGDVRLLQNRKKGGEFPKYQIRGQKLKPKLKMKPKEQPIVWGAPISNDPQIQQIMNAATLPNTDAVATLMKQSFGATPVEVVEGKKIPKKPQEKNNTINKTIRENRDTVKPGLDKEVKISKNALQLIREPDTDLNRDVAYRNENLFPTDASFVLPADPQRALKQKREDYTKNDLLGSMGRAIGRYFGNEEESEVNIEIPKNIPKVENNTEDTFRNQDLGYKELERKKDLDSPNPKDYLAVFSHGFDNDKGAVYKIGHMVAELNNPKNPMQFTDVKAVAHFIRNGDIKKATNPSLLSPYRSEHGSTIKSTSTGKFLSSPVDQKPEDYVMLYKDLGNDNYRVKYKKQKDLTNDDIKNFPDSYDPVNKRFDLNIKSYKFGDIDWEGEGQSTGWLTKSKFIPLKEGSESTKRNKTTYLPYKNKRAFSRFSGASVVFAFQDPKTKRNFAVDFAGSIEKIKEYGEYLSKKYKIKPEEIDLLHHDTGSYSAKPAAIDNTLNYKQWRDFNRIDQGRSGAPMMIVDESKIKMQKGGTVNKTNINKISYLSKSGKVISR